MDCTNWQTGTKDPLSADRSTNCLHQTVCFIPAPHHIFVHPVRVFNWNLLLHVCLSCTSVILFPLFWHLEASSVSPQHFHQKQAAQLRSLWEISNYSRAAPFAGLEQAKITVTVCKSLLQSSRNIFLNKLNRQQLEREERGRILGIRRDFHAYNSFLVKNKFSGLPLHLTLLQPERPATSPSSRIYSLELTLCVLVS